MNRFHIKKNLAIRSLKGSSMIALLICSLLLPALSRSQNQDLLYFGASAEKIYLQLDHRAYTTDQTIWFKAIVINAAQHTPSGLSGVLHVDLISSDEKIVDKKLIRVENGIGDGSFTLAPDYPEGNYLLRAYTEWDKNFGEDFFFKEYIQLFSPAPKSQPGPVNDVTIIGEKDNTRRIRASLDPRAIDSSHTKDLAVFIYLDDRKDSLMIKKNGAGNYLLDYPIPPGCQFVRLRLETKNNSGYSRTIVLSKDYLDLQFFPESGEMVEGIPCILGFKALDSAGKGREVRGEILNNRGVSITSFHSNILGMGTISLPLPDSEEHYIAEVASPDGTQKKSFPLPPVSKKGNTIAVTKNAGNVRLKISSNYLKEDSLSIRASCRGNVYFDIKGKLKNGSLVFSLPLNSLPEGVIAFTLIDDSLQPMAERLFFNERPETRLNLSISSDKKDYVQREKTQLTVLAKDPEGNPAPANLSVIVLSDTAGSNAGTKHNNILSCLLLTSDLKGRIENPGYYFGNDPAREEALDALLLTQGWRKYNYQEISGKISVQPEYALTVSGSVTGGLWGNRQKKGTSITMMTFGKPNAVDVQIADSLGRFSFPISNHFQGPVNVLIQTTNKSGTKKDYSIILDKKASPPVSFDHLRSVAGPDSIVKAYAKKSLDNKKTLDDYIAKTEGITLGEVILKSYAMTPERKKVTDQYGPAKTIIEGDDIRNKEAKWSYGLYSVLLFNFPDKIKIVRASDGVLYARLFNNETTLVVVDGIPVQAYDYALIPGIPPSEVKSFEVIEYAKNFSQLYCQVFPQSCIYAPAWGNVIAIYTYGKNGIFGANRAPGITKAAIQAYSAPKEFYAPKYDQYAGDWQKPDLRTLMHWAPKIQADSTGKALISFYNGDLTGRATVIAEAISPNGEIGYQQFCIDVKKRKADQP